MSPLAAWRILFEEENQMPDQIPTCTVELIARATEYRVERLVAKGTYPRFYDGPTEKEMRQIWGMPESAIEAIVRSQEARP